MTTKKFCDFCGSEIVCRGEQGRYQIIIEKAFGNEGYLQYGVTEDLCAECYKKGIIIREELL